MRLNLRRGFTRLGLASLLIWEGWIISVTVHEYLTTDQYPGLPECRQTNSLELSACEAAKHWVELQRWSAPFYPARRRTPEERFLTMIAVMFLPPLAVYAIVRIGAWIASGFRA